MDLLPLTYDDQDPDARYDELPDPWHHQGRVQPKLVGGSYALFWDRRTGKTRACGEALRVLSATKTRIDDIDRVLVLPPVNAKNMWADWLQTMVPVWRQYVCQGLKPQPIPPEYQVVICNPDIITHKGGASGHRGWQRELLEWMSQGCSVIIADEAHLYFTNPMSARYKALASLTRVAGITWVLTGTPMEKMALEIHHLLKLLGPTRYPLYYYSWDEFGRRFANATFNHYKGREVTKTTKAGKTYQTRTGGYDYSGIKDPATLWYQLRDCAERIRRIDVPELADGKTHWLPLWLAEKDQIEREDWSPADWQRAMQELVPLKIQMTKEYVEELSEDGGLPIVIWGWLRKYTEEIARVYSAPLIRGGTPADRRAQIYNEFQQGKHPILVCNIRAAGVASELTASHNAVYGQIWWDARAMAQSVDRHAGIKQKNAVLAHTLLVKGSVEEIIWDRVLLKGRAMVDLDEAAAQIQGIEWGELEDGE
jgi:hypothetical protein